MDKTINDYIEISDAAKLIHKQTNKSYIEIARLFKSELGHTLDLYHINEVYFITIIKKNQKQARLENAYELIMTTGISDEFGYKIPTTSLERMCIGEHPQWSNAYWYLKDFIDHPKIRELNLPLKENNSLHLHIDQLTPPPLNRRKLDNALKIIQALELKLKKPAHIQIEYDEANIKTIIKELSKEAFPNDSRPHSIAGKLVIFISSQATDKELADSFPAQETIAKWLS
ncbi:hypothetical protein [Acinetobacter baumannii]|uniref:hypothetical protein n=1 Tax=Acinetobacter baumannii TaxID=470 RepID=UPI002940848F|nr:hypothetical protein [Acinetobacter baumannii]MDV4329993.1 hypothetical protein [Acinetobacter baumannii]MDV4333453.1 hypothetical protein [Acinetobacter baumannii]